MTLDELRERYPQYSDDELIERLARKNGVDTRWMASYLGYEIPKQNESWLQDRGTDLKRGLASMPGGLAGIGDALLGAAEWGVGKVTGLKADSPIFDRPLSRSFSPVLEPLQQYSDRLNRYEYTPEQQESDQRSAEAWKNSGASEFVTSLFDPNADSSEAYAKANIWDAVKNTEGRTLVSGLVTSIPSMFGGGVLGRGARVLGGKAALGEAEQLGLRAAGLTEAQVGQVAAQAPYRMGAFTAGGIGEGSMAGGQIMQQIDPEVDARTAGIASFAGGGITGAIGGTVSKGFSKLGVRDLEATIAGQRVAPGEGILADAPWYQRIPARMGLGAVEEGLGQETWQSGNEQLWQNWAEEKPLGEGVLEQMYQGGVAGLGLGAGTNIYSRRTPPLPPLPVDTRQQVDLLSMGLTGGPGGGGGPMDLTTPVQEARRPAVAFDPSGQPVFNAANPLDGSVQQAMPHASSGAAPDMSEVEHPVVRAAGIMQAIAQGGVNPLTDQNSQEAHDFQFARSTLLQSLGVDGYVDFLQNGLGHQRIRDKKTGKVSFTQAPLPEWAAADIEVLTGKPPSRPVRGAAPTPQQGLAPKGQPVQPAQPVHPVVQQFLSFGGKPQASGTIRRLGKIRNENELLQELDDKLSAGNLAGSTLSAYQKMFESTVGMSHEAWTAKQIADNAAKAAGASPVRVIKGASNETPTQAQTNVPEKAVLGLAAPAADNQQVQGGQGQEQVQEQTQEKGLTNDVREVVPEGSRQEGSEAAGLVPPVQAQVAAQDQRQARPRRQDDYAEAERAVANAMLGMLPQRERQILDMYHGDKLSFADVADELNSEADLAEAEGGSAAVQRHTAQSVQTLHASAKKRLVTMLKSRGVANPEAAVDAAFPNETEQSRKAWTADVKTASESEVASLGGMQYEGEGTKTRRTLSADEEVGGGDVTRDTGLEDTEFGDQHGQFDTDAAEGSTSEASDASESDAGSETDTTFDEVSNRDLGDTDEGVLTALQRTVPNAQQVDIDDARDEYNARLAEDDKTFDDLPPKYRLQVARAFVNKQDGVLSDQQYERALETVWEETLGMDASTLNLLPGKNGMLEPGHQWKIKPLQVKDMARSGQEVVIQPVVESINWSKMEPLRRVINTAFNAGWIPTLLDRKFAGFAILRQGDSQESRYAYSVLKANMGGDGGMFVTRLASGHYIVVISPETDVMQYSTNAGALPKVQLEAFDHGVLHELGHIVENSLDSKTYGKTSHPELARSVITPEFDKAIESGNEHARQYLERYFAYPIATNTDYAERTFQSEVYAQIMAAYANTPEYLKRYFPYAYKLGERYAAEVKAGQDSLRVYEADNELASDDESDNPPQSGMGQQALVRPEAEVQSDAQAGKKDNGLPRPVKKFLSTLWDNAGKTFPLQIWFDGPSEHGVGYGPDLSKQQAEWKKTVHNYLTDLLAKGVPADKPHPKHEATILTHTPQGMVRIGLAAADMPVKANLGHLLGDNMRLAERRRRNITLGVANAIPEMLVNPVAVVIAADPMSATAEDTDGWKKPWGLQFLTRYRSLDGEVIALALHPSLPWLKDLAEGKAPKRLDAHWAATFLTLNKSVVKDYAKEGRFLYIAATADPKVNAGDGFVHDLPKDLKDILTEARKLAQGRGIADIGRLLVDPNADWSSARITERSLFTADDVQRDLKVPTQMFHVKTPGGQWSRNVIEKLSWEAADSLLGNLGIARNDANAAPLLQSVWNYFNKYAGTKKDPLAGYVQVQILAKEKKDLEQRINAFKKKPVPVEPVIPEDTPEEEAIKLRIRFGNQDREYRQAKRRIVAAERRVAQLNEILPKAENGMVKDPRAEVQIAQRNRTVEQWESMLDRALKGVPVIQYRQPLVLVPETAEPYEATDEGNNYYYVRTHDGQGLYDTPIKSNAKRFIELFTPTIVAIDAPEPLNEKLINDLSRWGDVDHIRRSIYVYPRAKDEELIWTMAIQSAEFPQIKNFINDTFAFAAGTGDFKTFAEIKQANAEAVDKLRKEYSELRRLAILAMDSSDQRKPEHLETQLPEFLRVMTDEERMEHYYQLEGPDAYITNRLPAIAEQFKSFDFAKYAKAYSESERRSREASFSQADLTHALLPTEKAYADGSRWVEVQLPADLPKEALDTVRPVTAEELASNRRESQESIGGQFVAVDADNIPIKNYRTKRIAVADTPENAWLVGRLIEEGNLMSHCVGMYYNSVMKKKSTIYSLRDADGAPHVTIEAVHPKIATLNEAVVHPMVGGKVPPNWFSSRIYEIAEDPAFDLTPFLDIANTKPMTADEIRKWAEEHAPPVPPAYAATSDKVFGIVVFNEAVDNTVERRQQAQELMQEFENLLWHKYRKTAAYMVLARANSSRLNMDGTATQDGSKEDHHKLTGLNEAYDHLYNVTYRLERNYDDKLWSTDSAAAMSRDFLVFDPYRVDNEGREQPDSIDDVPGWLADHMTPDDYPNMYSNITVDKTGPSTLKQVKGFLNRPPVDKYSWQIANFLRDKKWKHIETDWENTGLVRIPLDSLMLRAERNLLPDLAVPMIYASEAAEAMRLSVAKLKALPELANVDWTRMDSRMDGVDQAIKASVQAIEGSPSRQFIPVSAVPDIEDKVQGVFVEIRNLRDELEWEDDADVRNERKLALNNKVRQAVFDAISAVQQKRVNGGAVPDVMYYNSAPKASIISNHRVARARDATVTTIRSALQKYMPRVLTTHQLADQYSDKLVSLSNYIDSTDRMEQRQQSIMNNAHDILIRWQRMHGATKNLLNRLMRDATMAAIHPDEGIGKGTPNDHVRDTEAYERLKKQYEALPAEAKEIYKAVKKLMEDNWNARKAAYRQTITRAYDKLLSEATDQKYKDELIAERDAAIKAHKKQIETMKGPYFPLLRFGDYLMIAESAELKALRKQLETARGNEATKLRKQIEGMKRQSSHYAVEAFDTEYAAKRAGEVYRRRGMETRVQLVDNFVRNVSPFNAGAVDRISSKFAEAFDRQTAAKAKQLITQLYYSALPEHAALQRQLRRIGIEGATSDMLRAVSKVVQRDSFHLSRLEHAEEVADNLFKLHQEAKDVAVKTGNLKYQHVYKDLAARASFDFEYTETPILNVLTKMSSYWHLGMSPAYLMTNMSQPWMITAPVLAGKFGLGRATSAMRAAFVDVGRILTEGKGGTIKNFRDIQFTVQSVPNMEEREMLNYIKSRGQIDITQNVDLGLVADGVHPKQIFIEKIFGWANHHIEASNRIITALAAFRLARNSGMEKDAAILYAYKQVVDTQLDYTNANASYMMRSQHLGGLNKLIMQFRKYQQGMIYLLARNAQQAFGKGEEARAARGTLGYLMAMQMLMAGAIGIPIAMPVLKVFGLFAGGDDDDERGSMEVRFRNAIADMFGADVARALWKGLPTLLGLDVSQRVGMGELLNPLPYLRAYGKTGEEQFAQGLASALGAPFGMVGRMWDSKVLWEQGHWDKALEKFLPKMLADLARANRYTRTGITTRSGETAIKPDRIDGWDVTLRAMGFSPTVESEHYAAKQAKEDVARATDELRKRLLAKYAQAKLRGEDTEDVQDEIVDFNERHPHKGVQITRSAMIQAVQSRKQVAKERSETGVHYRKNQAYLKGIDRFAQ